jgi:hypothetical protein
MLQSKNKGPFKSYEIPIQRTIQYKNYLRQEQPQTNEVTLDDLIKQTMKSHTPSYKINQNSKMISSENLMVSQSIV